MAKHVLVLDRNCCQVLKEMRMCVETLNFAPMKGLIEEVQSYANRMEASLEVRWDTEYDSEIKLTPDTIKRMVEEHDLQRQKLKLELFEAEQEMREGQAELAKLNFQLREAKLKKRQLEFKKKGK